MHTLFFPASNKKAGKRTRHRNKRNECINDKENKLSVKEKEKEKRKIKIKTKRIK
jgi:hypothetical protein